MFALVLGRYRPMEVRPLPAVFVYAFVMLGLRLLLAAPFWASGQTRWVSFPTRISSTTTYLFENLFRLHFGLFELPIPFPGFVAHATALAEIVLPVLLVSGLLTRPAALALFAMTVVIQLVFPEAFLNLADPLNAHALWMACALLIVWFGPGPLSLDALVRAFGLGKAMGGPG